MANITLTVDDEVYRRARVHAAQSGTSVSSLVRSYLESLIERDAEFARLAAMQEDALADIATFSAGNRLARDEVHARAIR